MNSALFYLAASGMLCMLLWTPYILNRVVVWGIPAFASNYPSKTFPAEAPAIPVSRKLGRVTNKSKTVYPLTVYPLQMAYRMN
ncbi:MAG: hypothetical protein AAGA75_11805 [Cyanobacteria bacterium P01_E01_bin.6]